MKTKSIIQPAFYKDIPMPANPTALEAWWFRGLSQGYVSKVGDDYVATYGEQIYQVNVPAPAFVIEFETAH